jgi:GT2 family glycosyltransferase
VAVVSHNRVELLRRCLASLEKSEGRDRLQLIVVDNGSTDGSAELDTEFPNVQWIRLPKNFGMTKGWNLGWRAADAEYVFFLHADTEVDPKAAMCLADALDASEDAVAVCPLLVDAAGAPAPQLGSLPPDGTWQPADRVAPAAQETIPVAYPRGAALMVRVFYIRKIRQIDERYGQFGADADLAIQIRRAGRKILLVPAARVRHDPRGEYPAIERADFLLGRAVLMSRYAGFAAGLKARAASIFGPLLGLRFGELKYTLAGQKIDGSQK